VKFWRSSITVNGQDPADSYDFFLLVIKFLCYAVVLYLSWVNYSAHRSNSQKENRSEDFGTMNSNNWNKKQITDKVEEKNSKITDKVEEKNSPDFFWIPWLNVEGFRIRYWYMERELIEGNLVVLLK